MIETAELLEPSPRREWALLRQVGVTKVVSLLEDGEQRRRWLVGERGSHERWSPADQGAPPPGQRSWDLPALERLRSLYADHGLDLYAVEDTPPMDLVRLGQPGRDEQIEWFCDMLRNLASIDVRLVCYNWMALDTWARTDVAVPARGDALTTAYHHREMASVGTLVDPGTVTTDQLWEALAYFLEAVVPVAEEVGVRLGMHPDDPPLPELRGVPRIMNSLANYDRLLSLRDSPNSGITLCQGNFRLMTDDIPAAIRRFGKRIFFVHFRDVSGDAYDFVETFHDLGPTDLLACMQAYRDIGMSSILRPDHVPTLAGESNDHPGYAFLARLHAVGYIAGLREAVYGKKAVLAAANGEG